MFKVLKIDGPNLMTDKGGICLSPFSYADGGKTRPVDGETFVAMRALFVNSTALFEAAGRAAQLKRHAESCERCSPKPCGGFNLCAEGFALMWVACSAAVVAGDAVMHTRTRPDNPGGTAP